MVAFALLDENIFLVHFSLMMVYTFTARVCPDTQCTILSCLYNAMILNWRLHKDSIIWFFLQASKKHIDTYIQMHFGGVGVRDPDCWFLFGVYWFEDLKGVWQAFSFLLISRSQNMLLFVIGLIIGQVSRDDQHQQLTVSNTYNMVTDGQIIIK